MMTLTDESLKSISAEIESAKQNTINLHQTTDAINFSIEELSVRVRDSATSIAAVGMNATKLGEISQTLKSRI